MEQHRSLTSLAHARIRDMVLTGELAPGARIQIDALCRKLDMGASPVREALSILSSEELVIRHEQRGFRAPDISTSDFSALLETRCRIEGMALADAIREGGRDWEERIVLLRYRLDTLDRNEEAEAWEAAHREFHAALIATCPSSYLLGFCARLYDLAVRYRNVASHVAYPAREVDKEHAGIAEAALARDAERAVALLVDHYRTTGRFLHEGLAASESAGPENGHGRGRGADEARRMPV